ncbi:MAG: tetratricopeptide repeat protein [Puniceicoccales bacterium]|jgi:tetratricopeptide (TPR) repeat protein|nr:tetratricopeptide repeat protein [Puniceicoccales bacterium]
MKKKYLHMILTLLFMSMATVHAIDLSTAQMYIQEGNKCFGEKNLESAADYYEKALQYAPSAHVYFNLGNTYASLKRPGYALFYFLKAKQYRPRWTELNQTMQSLYQSYPTLPPLKSTWCRTIVQAVTLNTWVVVLDLCFWISIFLIIIYVCFTRRKIYLQLSCFCGVLFLCIGTLLYVHKSDLRMGVLIDENPIRFAPTESSPIRQSIPEGTLCEISDQRDRFTYIKTELAEGWILSEKIRPLYANSNS